MIGQFLLILASFWSFPAGLLGEMRCPQSCVCSKEKESMTCTGAPELKIISLLNEVPHTRLRKVYVQSFNIQNLTSVHIDTMIPWLRADISNDNCLSLARNNISDIRDNAFRHLGTFQLQRVTLTHNRLTVLRRGMFKGLSQIRELDLSFNNITNLHPGAFVELKLMGSIYLDNNQIVNIAPETFYSNDLWSLSVSENQLRVLRDNILAPDQKLTHLGASNNSIDEFAFTQFKSSFSLSLDGNLLTSIDFGTFFSFTDGAPAKLKSYIYLRRNKIRKIIPPQGCRTSLQHKQTVDTEIYMNDNLIPETFSPLNIFPCANGHVKNNISGEMYLNLEKNCFCRKSVEKVGGLQIETYSADCKIDNCPADEKDFILVPSTPVFQSSTRFSSLGPKPTTREKEREGTTTTAVKDPDEGATRSDTILGLRESVLYAIAASGVVCLIIIVITVAVCCFKKRQKRRELVGQDGSNPTTNYSRPPKDQSLNRSTPQPPIQVHTAPPNRYQPSFFPLTNPNLPGAALEAHPQRHPTGQQLYAPTPALDNSDARSDYTYMYLDVNQMGALGPHVAYDNAHRLRGQNDFRDQNNFGNPGIHVVQ